MKPTQNRTEIINALSNAGLNDFSTPEEMHAAHALLKDMLKNDAPAPRKRKSTSRHEGNPVDKE